MTMMLKRLLPVVALILIAGAVAVYFLTDRQTAAVAIKNEAMNVVPDDAVWMIESGSLHDLLKVVVQADPLFPAIGLIGNAEPYLDLLRRTESLISQDPRFHLLNGRRPSVLSFHQTGKSRYQFLLIVENQGASGISMVSDLFAEINGRTGQTTQRTYNGKQINRISFGPEAMLPGISVSEDNKFLLLSPSPILLENAVRQLSQENRLDHSASIARLVPE